MSAPLRTVIVGAGNRGLEGYGQCALQRPHLLQVVAAAEPVAERREEARRRHGLSQESLFDNWQQLAQRDPVAEVAIVCTPDHQHVEPTLALLKRGYHVLLEKPMATNEADCLRLVSAVGQHPQILAVCHVLRYAPYFREIKRFLAGGRLGQIVSMRHLEPVNFWRFCHSFVRGNWRQAEAAAPFILAKCCHDLDLLLYLMEKRCARVSSFGALSHFTAANRPPQAAERCTECALAEEKCPFSATRYYGDLLRGGHRGWPLNVLLSNFSEEALQSALNHGPYGRCVYACDNDVVDHQVVNLEFEDGSTAGLTAVAFTDHRVRETEIYGSRGTLKGDGSRLEFFDFLSRRIESWEVQSEGSHLGGDWGLLESLHRAVRTGDRAELDTGAAESLESHLIALAAERSRLTGRSIELLTSLKGQCP